MKEVPVLICIFFVPLALALLLALKTSGKRKLLVWGVFTLLTLPLTIGGLGGWMLSLRGLAWRSCVKLPVGLAYAAGVMALLVWAGVFLWRRIKWWAGQGIVLLAVGFLVLAVGWYGLLFSGIWAGSDRVMEYKGQTAVEEAEWMDWHYYAYHGPLVRGREALGHSWDDYHQRREAETLESTERNFEIEGPGGFPHARKPSGPWVS